MATLKSFLKIFILALVLLIVFVITLVVTGLYILKPPKNQQIVTRPQTASKLAVPQDLIVYEPHDGNVTNNSSVTLAGHATTPSVLALVNGQPIVIRTSDLEFSQNITLKPGINQVAVFLPKLDRPVVKELTLGVAPASSPLTAFVGEIQTTQLGQGLATLATKEKVVTLLLGTLTSFRPEPLLRIGTIAKQENSETYTLQTVEPTNFPYFLVGKVTKIENNEIALEQSYTNRKALQAIIHIIASTSLHTLLNDALKDAKPEDIHPGDIIFASGTTDTHGKRTEFTGDEIFIKK